MIGYYVLKFIAKGIDVKEIILQYFKTCYRDFFLIV